MWRSVWRGLEKRDLRFESNGVCTESTRSIGRGRRLAAGEQRRGGGEAVGEQLREVTVHERRRSEDVGHEVDVVVLHESGVTEGRSIMEILNSGPERRLFQTAEEVTAYLAEEKASWDR